MNCSSDFKHFANFGTSASNFKSFSQSLEHFFSQSRSEQFWKQNTTNLICIFFLKVGQNNFGNKVPILFAFVNLYPNTDLSFSRDGKGM